MILLIQNRQEYNNDLRAMMMAFYPGVKIVEDDTLCDSFDMILRAEYNEEYTLLAISNNENEDGCHTKIDADYRDKKEFRNIIKLAVYRLLCQISGRKLPWGDLTGVRPTKIAMSRLVDADDGSDLHDEIVDYYMNIYDVSGSKAELATRVAEKELELVRKIDMNNDYCLYVGIPFCPSRCLYCSFTSYPIGVYADKSVIYVDKLCRELDFIAEKYKDRRLVAVYVGGGTPTSISHELLDKLLGHIVSVFSLEDEDKKAVLREFTVEAGRPDSITAKKLDVMKKYGITRISINPQTMNDDTLRTIGRAHTAEQTREAFLMARNAGFDNINMDLIAGLPGENLDSMKHTLDEIRKLNPESITVHSLAIKRAANLRQKMDEYGASINQDMDAMHEMVAEAVKELGMEPYYMYRQKNIGGNLENVGYARNACECLYNVLIMEEMTDIIAAGAGSSTKLVYHDENRVERVENCKSVDDYIDRFDEMIDRKKKAFV